MTKDVNKMVFNKEVLQHLLSGSEYENGLVEEVFKTVIVNESGSDMIDLKLLYILLDVKDPYRKWVKRKVIDNDNYTENIDYISTSGKNAQRENTDVSSGFEKFMQSKNYMVKMELAEQLAMLQNNKIGHKVGKIYIAFKNAAMELMQEKLKQKGNNKKLSDYSVEELLMAIVVKQKVIIKDLEKKKETENENIWLTLKEFKILKKIPYKKYDNIKTSKELGNMGTERRKRSTSYTDKGGNEYSSSVWEYKKNDLENILM